MRLSLELLRRIRRLGISETVTTRRQTKSSKTSHENTAFQRVRNSRRSGPYVGIRRSLDTADRRGIH